MNAQERAFVQKFVDRCVGKHDYLGRLDWDKDGLAGALLTAGYPEADCERLAAYILADRETLRAAMLCESWPDFDFGPSVRGHTWDLYPKPIPFFVGNLEREVHFPADEAPDEGRMPGVWCGHDESFWNRADYEYERSMDR